MNNQEIKIELEKTEMERVAEFTNGEPSKKNDKYKNEKETYLNQLSSKDKKSCKIAEKLLGSSFQLEKSVAFLDWLKKQTK
jgi:hypothetical protein